MALSIIVTFAFVLGEGITGFVSHSLALMSDAGHNFADALALMLSWYGFRSALRPSTSERTFGYHRVGILAALANSLSLVLIATIMVAEQSIRSGEQVLRAVNEELCHHFRINHTTIQVEVEGCARDDIYCTMQAMRSLHGTDHH